MREFCLHPSAADSFATLALYKFTYLLTYLLTKYWNRRPCLYHGLGLGLGLEILVLFKPISQLQLDYDTTTIRLRRKIDMFVFCLRRIGRRRARYVVVGSSRITVVS